MADPGGPNSVASLFHGYKVAARSCINQTHPDGHSHCVGSHTTDEDNQYT